MAYQGDMLSRPVCHFGGFLGGLGFPIRRRCRTAISTRATPISDLHGQSRQRGCRARLRRLVARDQDGDGHDDGQGSEPSEDEGGTLASATLGQKDEQEGGEGDRLEGDHQADKQEIEDHAGTTGLPLHVRIYPPCWSTRRLPRSSANFRAWSRW